MESETGNTFQRTALSRVVGKCSARWAVEREQVREGKLWIGRCSARRQYPPDS